MSAAVVTAAAAAAAAAATAAAAVVVAVAGAVAHLITQHYVCLRECLAACWWSKRGCTDV